MSSIQSLVNQTIATIAQAKIAKGLKEHAVAAEKETKIRAEEVLSTKEERVITAGKEVEATQEALSKSKAPGKVKELTQKIERQKQAYSEAEASLEAAKARLRGDYHIYGGKSGKAVM